MRRFWRHRPDVVVYTRQGCGLCRQAQALVAREARRARIRLVDVDDDPALADRYGIRVPVVLVDGDEVAELEVAPGVVRRAVRTARRPPAGGAADPRGARGSRARGEPPFGGGTAAT